VIVDVHEVLGGLAGVASWILAVLGEIFTSKADQL
jgi:hypothetical protein